MELPIDTSLADQIRLATIVRDLSPERLEAWLTCGRRIVAGMPIAEAAALMWSELPVPEGAI